MTQHLTNFYRTVDSLEFDSSIIYLSAKSLMPSINRLVESTKQLFSDQFIAEFIFKAKILNIPQFQEGLSNILISYRYRDMRLDPLWFYRDIYIIVLHYSKTMSFTFNT